MALQACCQQQPTGDGNFCEELEPCECTNDRLGTAMGEGTTCSDFETPFGFSFCNSEACCLPEVFPGAGPGCEDVEFGLCGTLTGGVGLGLGTRCEFVTCPNPDDMEPIGACCFDGQCLDLPLFSIDVDNCFARFGDWQEGKRCADVDIDCGIDVACCLPGGGCDDLTPTQCCNAQGQPQGSGTTCENTADLCTDLIPPGCREAGEDQLPPDRLPWGADLCQNAFFAPVIRPPEHYPQPGDEGLIDFEPGFVELRSMHPTRIMELSPNDLRDGLEVCGYHYGRMRVHDGFARPIFCGQPDFNDPESKVSSPLHVMIDQGEKRTTKPPSRPPIRPPRRRGELGEPVEAVPLQQPTQAKPEREWSYKDLVEQGSAFFVGSYQVPWIKEVRYDSFSHPCLPPVE